MVHDVEVFNYVDRVSERAHKTQSACLTPGTIKLTSANGSDAHANPGMMDGRDVRKSSTDIN